MQVQVLGCGEAFDQDLFNTSLLLRGSQTILLDCGYAMPPRIWQACPDINTIDVIYISHAHADHYFGLPAVLTRMSEEKREKPLIVISQPEVLQKIEATLDLGYSGARAKFPFPLELTRIEEGSPLLLDDVEFRAALTLHSVSNFAVRVAMDNVTLCYSGDGLYTPASQILYTSADLLIHEAYNFEASPVHGDIPGVARLAEEARVKQLALTHVQRNIRREPDFRARVVAVAPTALLPEPGQTFNL